MKKFFATVLIVIAVLGFFWVIFFKNNQCESNNPFSIEIPSSSNSFNIKADSKTLVTQIQRLDRLETATIKIEEEFIANKNSDSLWGLLGEKLVFVAKGEVIAGIDFSKFEKSDVEIIGNNIIKITIPTAEIFYSIIDNNESFIKSRSKGFLVFFNDKDIETAIRVYAQNSFKSKALKEKIIFTAQTNAINNIQDLARKLGFDQVIITIK